jgi:hypothetical protein
MIRLNMSITMSKIRQSVIILGIALSPVWVGCLAIIGQPSDSLAGLAVLFGAILGMPVIAITGLVVSFSCRNRPNANQLSIAGYAVPAVLVCAYELYMIFG